MSENNSLLERFYAYVARTEGEDVAESMRNSPTMPSAMVDGVDYEAMDENRRLLDSM